MKKNALKLNYLRILIDYFRYFEKILKEYTDIRTIIEEKQNK